MASSQSFPNVKLRSKATWFQLNFDATVMTWLRELGRPFGSSPRITASSSPPDHPGRRICCLLSVVSGIGQPIEIASQAVQPILDGSRCRPLGCLARFSGFPAIILGRLRWRVCGLIHEPHMVGTATEVGPSRRVPRPAGQTIFGRNAICSMGNHGVRLLTLGLGERLFYPLP